MDRFWILVILLIKVSESRSEPLWCGRPPECKCFIQLKIVQCLGVDELPLLSETVRSDTRTVVITSKSMVSLPRLLLNKTEFKSLEKINVLMTNVACAEIQEAREKRKDLDILSHCLDKGAETTTPSQKIISGKPPSGTEVVPTEGYNGTWNDITSVKAVSTGKPIVMGLVNFNTQWITSGVILTGINLLAIMMIVLFIILRHRRQCCRSGDHQIRNLTELEMMIPTQPVPPPPVPVETIGSVSSEESIELYTVQSRPSRPHLKRRSIEKEL